MAEVLFRARRCVVDGVERAASIRVRGERIVAVEDLDSPVGDARLVEVAEDEVLLPGLVDTHVHVNDPGRSDWEGFPTATAAAAAGGVTTIIDMPLNSIPPTTDVAALAAKRAAAEGRCWIDVGFWGGAVPGNAGELAALHDAGVFGFKCFLLDSGVPEFGHLDRTQLVEHLRVIAGLDSLLIAHAEDAASITAPPPGREYAGFLASRPPGAETAAIRWVSEAARETGARAHIVHLSAADSLPLDGVSAETCPHYLILTAEDVPPGATEFKCCPPIRGAANRDRLWQALADGAISMIVSDHSPCTPDLKRFDTGDFAAAWGGIASVQLGLSAVWTEASRRGHGLPDVARWMAEAPAALVGLRRKGHLAPGFDADLVVFAPDEWFTVDAAALRHRNPVSAYHGRRLRGVVRSTWSRGAPAAAGRGRLLDGNDRRGSDG